jgi:hypothetical protein
VVQRVPHGGLQLARQRAQEDVRFQVADGLDLGQRPLPARFRDQRNVVAAALVPAGAAEVEQAVAVVAPAPGLGQVAAGGQHGGIGNVEPLASGR